MICLTISHQVEYGRVLGEISVVYQYYILIYNIYNMYIISIIYQYDNKDINNINSADTQMIPPLWQKAKN